ncbi:MAG TPA: alpha/beta fold hydrolase [Gaiellaceae bacterium]|nr:alpha/beta fold hydrolase [Gaiellaceae bacterium]
MSSYVLVHGAWHGAWCWDKVVPLLEAEGHSVTAVDLPGHGEDGTALAGLTQAEYGRRVADAVEAAGQSVVLVGHSMGGMAITQAAEYVPERIATLVYVCAFLAGPGDSLTTLADNDPDARVLPNLVVDEAAGLCEVAPAARVECFYEECDPADAAAASARLGAESLAAFATPVSVTQERAGSVRRIYVECVRDHAISIAKQREMWGARPCERVETVDTDHSPFLSRPEELAAHLLAV